jgi:hypothetical protein
MNVRSEDNLERYSYLFETANKIYAAQSGYSKLTSAQLAGIAAEACQTLARLEQDQDFLADVRRLGHDDDREKRQAMMRDLTSFITAFAQPESNFLKSAHLSDDVVLQIISSAAFLKNALDANPDPTEILNAIGSLRNDICDAKERLAGMAENEKSRAEWRDHFVRWSMGIGGVVLIAIDTGGAVPSGGLSEASSILGVAAVKTAVR